MNAWLTSATLLPRWVYEAKAENQSYQVSKKHSKDDPTTNHGHQNSSKKKGLNCSSSEHKCYQCHWQVGDDAGDGQ